MQKSIKKFRMIRSIQNFLLDDSGAVTVDWTVLSAATVGMSLATVAVLNGGIQGMVSRMDAELREQQMSDNFIQFTSEHFEPLYENGFTTAAEAEAAHNVANQMMNQEIIDALQYGIEKLEAGLLNTDQIVTLMALASVARQRNIIDPNVLDYYFGTDGANGKINDYL